MVSQELNDWQICNSCPIFVFGAKARNYNSCFLFSLKTDGNLKLKSESLIFRCNSLGYLCYNSLSIRLIWNLMFSLQISLQKLSKSCNLLFLYLLLLSYKTGANLKFIDRSWCTILACSWSIGKYADINLRPEAEKLGFRPRLPNFS